jgi:hypothetical protein
MGWETTFHLWRCAKVCCEQQQQVGLTSYHVQSYQQSTKRKHTSRCEAVSCMLQSSPPGDPGPLASRLRGCKVTWTITDAQRSPGMGWKRAEREEPKCQS